MSKDDKIIFKTGWISGYYPFSEYSINANQVVYGGDTNYMDHHLLTQSVIMDSMKGFSGDQKGGMKIKDLKNFYFEEKSGRKAFKKLEGKVDEYFRKNKNLEGGEIQGLERMFVLSLKTLDDGKEKILIKIYRKKNI